jgi:phage terminase Nu1 subunit (DNA packaging protein)
MRNSGIVEISRTFGVTLETVVNWCERGLPHDNGFKGLKPVKRFDVEEVKEWINEQRKG